MSKLFTGSLCLTEILDKAKAGHSAFSKAKNGKIYFNILQWHNDEPDNYGNDVSIQLNSTKDKQESEGKIYIGNVKAAKAKEPTPVTAADIVFDDDLPF